MKTCVLCPAIIKPHHRLCYACYKQYGANMHDPWFIELERMQLKQDKIDRLESFSLAASIAVDTVNSPIQLKKSVGRPATSWIKINKVLRVYDESVEAGKPLSLRKLQAAVNNEVKYLVIRKILMRYRPNNYNQI